MTLRETLASLGQRKYRTFRADDPEFNGLEITVRTLSESESSAANLSLVDVSRIDRDMLNAIREAKAGNGEPESHQEQIVRNAAADRLDQMLAPAIDLSRLDQSRALLVAFTLVDPETRLPVFTENDTPTILDWSPKLFGWIYQCCQEHNPAAELGRVQSDFTGTRGAPLSGASPETSGSQTPTAGEQR